jgi:hypothetical protein
METSLSDEEKARAFIIWTNIEHEKKKKYV